MSSLMLLVLVICFVFFWVTVGRYLPAVSVSSRCWPSAVLTSSVVRVLCVCRGVCVCACVMRACMLVRVCVRACTVPSVSVSTHASSLQTNVLSPSPTRVHQHLLCADAVGSVGAVLGEATAPASSGGFGVGARAVTGQRVQCHHAAGPGLFLRSPAEACGVLSSDRPGVSAAHGFLWL